MQAERAPAAQSAQNPHRRLHGNGSELAVLWIWRLPLKKVFCIVPSRLIGRQLRGHLPDRAACRLMVNVLSLAHDRCCEAQLA